MKWDESTRTLTITPATGNPVTYTIADADTKDGNTQYTLETKAEGKTVTITLKNDKGEVILHRQSQCLTRRLNLMEQN